MLESEKVGVYVRYRDEYTSSITLNPPSLLVLNHRVYVRLGFRLHRCVVTMSGSGTCADNCHVPATVGQNPRNPVFLALSNQNPSTGG